MPGDRQAHSTFVDAESRVVVEPIHARTWNVAGARTRDAAIRRRALPTAVRFDPSLP